MESMFEMKRRIGIVTLVDYNLGNRLQNYALQEFLKDKGYAVATIGWRKFDRKKVIVKSIIKKVYLKLTGKKSYNYTWELFDLNIDWSDVIIPYDAKNVEENVKEKFDCFAVGSDQVWNPNFYYYVPRAFLEYADDDQKVAFSASFGVSDIPQENVEEYTKALSSFRQISVREDAGAEIVKKLTGKDAQVLVDPTMLMSKERWSLLAKKSKFKPKGKFVVKYFLGEVSKEYDEFIEKKARELGAQIIDVLHSDETWIIGPSEFIYLYEHAEAAFVDSFHGSVFSILFNKPFAVFDRIGTEGTGNMNSRIDTLLRTFELENHRIANLSAVENLDMNFDVEKVQRILEVKRKEASDFADKAFR